MSELAAREVTREDLVLLLAAGAKGPYELDPIRVMKGCFIISQIGRPSWRSKFRFRPYDYGPFDSGVYAARDGLIAEGLLTSEKTGRYASYSLTGEGEERVQELREIVGPKGADWIAGIGRYVTSKSFARLLDEIYGRWPEFAEQSVIRR